MARYGMAIDTKRCVGCNACTTACKMANNVPDDIFWTRALTRGGDEVDTPAGTFPNLSMRYYTVGCQHCENPACVKACPVGATYKDPETGRVPLGDMAISLERAKQQAQEFGHSTRREVGYLTIHSILHLLGYDHVDEGPMKRQMRAREEAILAEIELPRK